MRHRRIRRGTSRRKSKNSSSVRGCNQGVTRRDGWREAAQSKRGSGRFSLRAGQRKNIDANNNPSGVGGFKKGQSGNPGGLKRKDIGDLSREARRYASLAVSTLVKICRKGMERNQLAAARELLDHGYGRPLQMVDVSLLRKKLTELSPDELAALEARLLTEPATDVEEAQLEFRCKSERPSTGRRPA